MTLDKFASILATAKHEFIMQTNIEPNVVSIGAQCKCELLKDKGELTIIGLRVIHNLSQVTSHVVLYTTANLDTLG